ncbi:MAG: chromosome segregation protein SMC [Lachnospiraceae bacterium]|nr:chromosome segregation protein SMC [Lachnospiraceae bacterium]
MYLKSIEINGFKSFANKIVFEFPHGITGIVGPNGSGKSNIGDAVRWVLGEQSAKQLRGSRMEDVIFSGTENRRPLGFAYVAIIFDNSDRKIQLDYDEVKVARRVYRSGESEYLLNGSTCRRRDIVEIFYDTGIGKEGYSIIGQGQVEKILSGKIEDSRELFDEAAGIAKYKKNRSVTEKSLEQEHQNLERVTDVLSELEKQVGPLESQSKKAKEYLKLKEKEKELDIHLFLYDHDNMKKELEEIQRQQSITGKDLNETRAAYEQVKEKNNRLQEDAEKIASKIDDAETKKEDLNARKDEKENETILLRHKMESNQLLMDHYKELIKQSLSDQAEKKKLLEEQNAQIEQSEHQLKQLSAQKEQQKEKRKELEIRRDVLNEKMSARKDALFSMMDSQSDTKEKLSRYDTMEEQLQIRNAEYNSRLIAFQSEKKEYNEKAARLEVDMQKIREQHQEASLLYDRKLTEYSAFEDEESRKRRFLEQENQEFLKSRSRYETLAGITERYDGYNQSIKHIMEQKKTHPGIIGVVADILTLDKEYETAIEIALGGALQNVVTENDRIAKEMIGFLKKNRLGRATFLPLTNIRKKNITIHPAILEEEGVIGVASDLVTVEARFDNLVQSLLGRTVVVDNVDHALLLSKKNNYSLRIVTIGGELLNPGGSITGGAFRHSGNLLGRKREMEECRARMETARENCQSVQQELSVLTQKKEDLQTEIDSQKEILDHFQLQIHDLNHQIPDLLEKEKELKHKIAALKEEHASLQRQLEDIRQEKEILSEDQLQNEKLHEKNNDTIDRLEKEGEVLTTQIKEMETQENQKILEIAQLKQQMEFISADCERLQTEIAACGESQKEQENQRQEMIRQNKESEEALLILSEELKKLNEQIAEVLCVLDRLKAEQKSISGKHNLIFQELENHNDRLLVLEKENTRLLTRKEKLETELESRIDYMWENYEITYNYAKKLKRYDIRSGEVEVCRKEKKEILQQIKQLGNVNINAIEEYKSVGERYEFLRGQYDDIKEAEEKLQKMIQELNDAMQEQFTSRFQEIREMFMVVFKDLFEGGTADLELMDDTNMLECGIRIVAQPPGKKLQNIMLLSGGERALTAIALLFAIQRLKPSPFCLLDEIEAALDDANIVRFSRYLKKLSEDTQFIVITHRRGTMNAAEALYGITMQEKGVSTLISVDLIDKELDE